MTKLNVNEKGIVLPPTTKARVEKELDKEQREQVKRTKEELDRISAKVRKMEIDGNIKELMEEYEIPTLVSLARVTNIAPQQLYAARVKDPDTGEYVIGDRVERAVLRAAMQHTNMTTVEEVMQAARQYLDDKELAKKIRQQSKQNGSKEKGGTEPVSNSKFKVGDLVEYDTHRAGSGIKEYYVRKGEIVKFLDNGRVAKIKTDDGAEVDIACDKLRLQE